MAKKQSTKVIKAGNSETPGTEVVAIDIPDEAVSFIVSRYISKKNVDDVPLIVGISTDDVETVLGLFIEWAGTNGYIREGVLFMGEKPAR